MWHFLMYFLGNLWEAIDFADSWFAKIADLFLIVSAALLAHKTQWHGKWKSWEEPIMRYALYVFLVLFFINAFIVIPYYKLSEAAASKKELSTEVDDLNKSLMDIKEDRQRLTEDLAMDKSEGFTSPLVKEHLVSWLKTISPGGWSILENGESTITLTLSPSEYDAFQMLRKEPEAFLYLKSTSISGYSVSSKGDKTIHINVTIDPSLLAIDSEKIAEPRDPDAWPPLSDSELQEWESTLANYPGHDFIVCWEEDSTSKYIFRSLKAISKRLNWAIHKNESAPQFEGIEIRSAKNDPIGVRLAALFSEAHFPTKYTASDWGGPTVIVVLIGGRPAITPPSLTPDKSASPP
jgi:hypothetical protein